MSQRYACASICSAPSARSVPLPPIEWINRLQIVPTDTSRPSSSMSSESVSSSSPPPSIQTSSSYGIRLCPFQLIAAAATA
uniref:Secreted protein n=1 Tax=Caenorhabditis tropicalis TaxID=1561998 RepID=A0A1I7TU18_9PELO